MDDAERFGPKMQALTEKQRRFVLAMAADPFGNAKRWAVAAGYSDVGNGAKVRGFHLIHDPAIEEAVLEFARGALSTVGPILATFGMLRIARNPKHPKHARALEMVANRVGMHEASEHTVNVNHSDRTGAAMIESITKMAAALGVDPAQLLGMNAANGTEKINTPKQIEGQVIDGDVSR